MKVFETDLKIIQIFDQTLLKDKTVIAQKIKYKRSEVNKFRETEKEPRRNIKIPVSKMERNRNQDPYNK